MASRRSRYYLWTLHCDWSTRNLNISVNFHRTTFLQSQIHSASHYLSTVFGYYNSYRTPFILLCINFLRQLEESRLDCLRSIQKIFISYSWRQSRCHRDFCRECWPYYFFLQGQRSRTSASQNYYSIPRVDSATTIGQLGRGRNPHLGPQIFGSSKLDNFPTYLSEKTHVS